MANSLNVLSIDFDFFQKVDAETLSYYPDGIDLSTELSQVVWASHYTDPKKSKKLMDVKIDEQKISEMIQILKRCKNDIPVLVTNSHVKIYEFITENARKKGTSRVNLTNVDLHHDMFNDNYEIDCGNWIKFISEDFDTSVCWIANPVSKECYGLTKKVFDQIKEDFSQIKPEDADILFICRSDTWFPPHLDPYFSGFIKALHPHFPKMYGESAVKTPRNVTPMKTEIENIYKFNKNR